MTLKVEWLDSGREPRVRPNPDYPEGIDIDASMGAARTCSVDLPYPAKRIGVYLVTCATCRSTTALTTAGRPDDPRSVKVACRAVS
jgi:hypothetical protein